MDNAKPYWNEEIETMQPRTLRELEAGRLQNQMAYVYRTSPWYARRFDRAGVRPDDIRDQADLARLPFTEKSDLTTSQVDGSLVGIHQCAPQEDIVRITGTGGTTGRPLRLPFTRKDIVSYSEQGARALWAMGCRPADIVINVFNYSIYAGGVTGGASFEYLGATVVPYGIGQSARLFDMMAHLRDELSIYATPSYAVRLIERAEEYGVDLKSLGVRKGFLSGEAGLQIPGYRARIETNWGMKARDLYGAAEVGAHSAECGYLNGLHWFGGGLVVVELIDPETGEPIAFDHEAVGELVFTTLEREAGPVVRLRTHDIVQIFNDPCPCGRTSFRFRTLTRSDDMFVVKGINVYPTAIQNILAGMRPRLTGEYRVLLHQPPPIDYEPQVQVEVAADVPETDFPTLSTEVREMVRTHLNFTPQITLIRPGQIASQHKTRRVYRTYKGESPN